MSVEERRRRRGPPEPPPAEEAPPRRVRTRTPQTQEEPVAQEREVPQVEDGETFDYDADLAINPFFLDAEFLNHARIAMRYNKEAARANKAAMEAEEKVKTKRSELVKIANETPEVMGNGIKPTAPNVEAYYRMHPEYKKIKQSWIDAVYYADLMRGAVAQFAARKCAIEGEIKLFGMNYFANPQEPRDLPEAVKRLEELKSKNTQQSIKESLNRRQR